MKIIDLLQRIANDNGVPIKLLVFGKHYEWKQPVKDYMNEDGDYLIEELISADLNCLCEEIPLIEEDKKIEKIEQWVDVKSWAGNDLKKGLEEQSEFNKIIYYKINEIIDVMNKGDK